MAQVCWPVPMYRSILINFPFFPGRGKCPLLSMPAGARGHAQYRRLISFYERPSLDGI